MSAIKQEILMMVEKELYEDEQDQIAIRKEEKRLQRRAQALIASGMLLSSLMGVAVGETIGSTQTRVLSVAEADAISNLMDYVAYKMNASRDWVEDVVLAEFNVRSLDELCARHYDEVIEYLLHLVH